MKKSEAKSTKPTVVPKQQKRPQPEVAEAPAVGNQSAPEINAECESQVLKVIQPAMVQDEAFGPYRILDGSIWYSGGDKEYPLCNFAAKITGDVIRYDGESEPTRHFAIEGITKSGTPLERVFIPISAFGQLNWVQSSWGMEAIIYAGYATRDRLREAIQRLSGRVPTKRVFTHTGWTLADGQYAYIHSDGAIGAAGIEVDLDTEIQRYRLELPKNTEEKVAALRASLDFLSLAPYSLTIPLWSGLWLSTVSTLLSVDFVLWVLGQTGTLKTALAAIIQAHFGSFDERHLPGSFLSTANSLEKACFLAKDTAFVIDDYAPGANSYEAREMEGKAHRIIRAAGNRTGRARLRSDTTLRAAYVPRGLIYATGEQTPTGGGESMTARLFVVETQMGQVDLDKLTDLQKRLGLLPKAMGAFIEWLAPDLGNQITALKDEWADLRHKGAKSGHLRIPSSTAYLQVGLRLGTRFFQNAGALDSVQANDLIAKGDEALLALAKAQTELVKDEQPAIKFLLTIQELLENGSLQFEGINTRGNDIGWYDDDYYYLHPKTALVKVKDHLRKADEYFGISPKALDKQLYEQGFLEKDFNPNVKRYGVKATRSSAHAPRWVIKLKRKKVDEIANLARHVPEGDLVPLTAPTAAPVS